ncbi:Arc family DNA-binding protein [Shewanella sp. 1180_01]|uniref:Arc family DNA-binding protein n=1 Tax=Shewanella sp. 1180_01 TaxID=2604451 RepID=UPI004062A1D2
MREHPQLRLRVAPELKEQIDQSAKINGRSMNAEIVHRLELSFVADQNPAAASLLHGDALENLLTPTLPASIAGKIARNNANSGIALASVFVDEINELINGAVVLGKRKIELDITKIIGSMPATDAEISIALKLVEKIFDDAGYSVEIKSDSIIMTF